MRVGCGDDGLGVAVGDALRKSLTEKCLVDVGVGSGHLDDVGRGGGL